MNVIVFDASGHNAPAYSCNKPGDNSGEYVDAKTAQDLLEALELMVTTHDEGGWPTATITIARAAIAKARGV